MTILLDAPRGEALPTISRTTTQPEALGCDEGLTIGGRAGGLAVAPDGTVFVSVPDSRDVWRFERGAAVATETWIDQRADGAERPLLAPAGLAIAPDGTLFLADRVGHRVWAITCTGERRVVAGSLYGYRDGPADEALFRYPSDVAIGPDGSCYVADAGNHRIRAISPDGIVTTLAGSLYDFGDGRGPDGRFREPLAIGVDHEGICYVADTGNNAIRRVTSDGEVTTVAGRPPGGDADGVGPEVGMRWPTGIAVGHDRELWVADHGNGALRRIDSNGAATTTYRFAGRGRPVAVALTPDDELLVAAEMVDGTHERRACLVTSGVGR